MELWDEDPRRLARLPRAVEGCMKILIGEDEARAATTLRSD
jgi:hypothetical protein